MKEKYLNEVRLKKEPFKAKIYGDYLDNILKSIQEKIKNL